MVEPEEQKNKFNINIDNLDNLLSKYISVWLWSILFGANTGVLVSFYTRQELRGWGSITIILLGIWGVGSIFLILSFVYLFSYLKLLLIPIFIEKKPIENISYKKTSIYLIRSFNYFLASLFLGLLAEFIKTIFSAIFY